MKSVDLEMRKAARLGVRFKSGYVSRGNTYITLFPVPMCRLFISVFINVLMIRQSRIMPKISFGVSNNSIFKS